MARSWVPLARSSRDCSRIAVNSKPEIGVVSLSRTANCCLQGCSTFEYSDAKRISRPVHLSEDFCFCHFPKSEGGEQRRFAPTLCSEESGSEQ